MNFRILKSDSIIDVVKKRIAFFKETHERHLDPQTRAVCQVKITTLEMVLNDIYTLDSVKGEKLNF